MNLRSSLCAFRRAALGLGLGLIGMTTAQAGAVSVDFDPAFGSALPNLNWGGTFSFFVSDNCIAQAPENVLTSVCQPTLGTGTLTLTDTVTLQSITAAFNLNVSKLYVTNDAVVAWETNRTDWLTDFRSLPAAKGSDFRFGYTSLLPALFAKTPSECESDRHSRRNSRSDSRDRDDDHDDECEYDIHKAEYNGLDGIITNVVRGQTVTYRLSYDAGAVFTPQAEVPEPGSLALLGLGLVAAGMVRRRRG